MTGTAHPHTGVFQGQLQRQEGKERLSERCSCAHCCPTGPEVESINLHLLTAELQRAPHSVSSFSRGGEVEPQREVVTCLAYHTAN